MTQPNWDPGHLVGSGQLVRQVNICNVPVLSTQVKLVESARDIQIFRHWQQMLRRLVQAFITCRLDYCNSLLYGVSLSNNLLQKYSPFECRHISLLELDDANILFQYCWSCTGFPFVEEWEFKLACLVQQSLAGQTTTYLASDIQLTVDTGCRQLWSASERICVIPRTHNSFGDTVEVSLLPVLMCRMSCRHIHI